jgi:hypothetical protein
MRFLTTFQIADFLDTLLSLFTAFVLGTLIGAERQYRQRTGWPAHQCAGRGRRSRFGAASVGSSLASYGTAMA